MNSKSESLQASTNELSVPFFSEEQLVRLAVLENEERKHIIRLPAEFKAAKNELQKSPKNYPDRPSKVTPIQFHLILTRFYQNTSILEFRRPPEIVPVMFNYRHRRVLESIFFHHPNARVTLHSNFMIQDDFRQFTDANYSLRVLPLDFENLAVGTPLQGATRDPKWKAWEAGRHWYTSFSNLYRLLLLWKVGGIYMDTDMLVTKPFYDLDRAIGFQDPARRMANNAVLVFKEPGNPYVWRCLEEISSNYSTKLWGANGPSLLSRVWRRWNATEERDAAVRVLDSDSFFLFLHSKVRAHCFGSDMEEEERAWYAQALAARVPYAVHLANKMSGDLFRTDLQPGTFCHYLLTRFCVFCDDEPRRPPAYPPVVAGGARIELA